MANRQMGYFELLLRQACVLVDRFYEEYSVEELDQQNFYDKLLALKKEQEEHLKLGTRAYL
jgi:hypothetical protein